jgi:hypothetical protein
VDEHRDGRHDDEHHDGQRINMEVNVVGEFAEVEPVVNLNGDTLRLEFMQDLLIGGVAEPAQELRADEAGVEESQNQRAEGDPADDAGPESG